MSVHHADLLTASGGPIGGVQVSLWTHEPAMYGHSRWGGSFDATPVAAAVTAAMREGKMLRVRLDDGREGEILVTKMSNAHTEFAGNDALAKPPG